MSVADKVWKGQRVPELEDLVVAELARTAGRERWEAFLLLDDILGELAAGADARLALQASRPVVGHRTVHSGGSGIRSVAGRRLEELAWD
ncbi:hypothetical protein [Actinoplanes sp. RD1]|uniref:hypothetical protein n=1 Tax=Actinoplanes sp. RD1 TaxID=3064538 RepID=UPI002740D76F|nr:hypothetical protein [Actinoplanes sp. RD1]